MSEAGRGLRLRVRLLFSGRVQGVWFRGSMQQQAETLGLGGWVRNLRDGRVEALIVGPAKEVEALVEWAGVGPSGARVDRVERFDETGAAADGEAPAGFEIVR